MQGYLALLMQERVSKRGHQFKLIHLLIVYRKCLVAFVVVDRSLWFIKTLSIDSCL